MKRAAIALWVCGVVLAGAGASLAEEPTEAPPEAPPPAAAKREVKNGKLTDPHWGLVFEAGGMTETTEGGGQDRIFAGSCPDGVRVEILVAEGGEEMTSAEWSASRMADWKKRGRSMAGVEEPEGPVPTILFVEKGLAGQKRHHGYAFHARGLQCFVVHADAEEKTETSGAAILEKLRGLRLGEETGASLKGLEFAKRNGKPPSDPGIRLMAGRAYASTENGIPALSLRLLTRLQKEVGEEGLDIDGRWALHETLGLACLLLKKPREAIPWLKEAESLSKRCSDPAALDGQSTYNLACAYSLAGETDEAFDTLLRCSKKRGWMISWWPSAQKDPDLAPLKSDPRWKHLGKIGR